MTDLHTHILPGVDDGAGSVEEALRMTEALYGQNVHTAVCTPHFNPTRMSLQEFIRRRSEAMAEMGSSRVKLLSASETALHEYLFHYPDLSGLCIEQTRYLIIELSFHKKWKKTPYQSLERMMDYYDLIPIIAHIDRYPAANKRSIRRLRELGCLLQMNSEAILTPASRRRALRWLRNGDIDVLGSDCHNMTNRRPELSPALAIIRERLGEGISTRLIENSDNLVSGKELKAGV